MRCSAVARAARRSTMQRAVCYGVVPCAARCVAARGAARCAEPRAVRRGTVPSAVRCRVRRGEGEHKTRWRHAGVDAGHKGDRALPRPRSLWLSATKAKCGLRRAPNGWCSASSNPRTPPALASAKAQPSLPRHRRAPLLAQAAEAASQAPRARLASAKGRAGEAGRGEREKPGGGGRRRALRPAAARTCRDTDLPDSPRDSDASGDSGARRRRLRDAVALDAAGAQKRRARAPHEEQGHSSNALAWAHRRPCIPCRTRCSHPAGSQKSRPAPRPRAEHESHAGPARGSDRLGRAKRRTTGQGGGWDGMGRGHSQEVTG